LLYDKIYYDIMKDENVVVVKNDDELNRISEGTINVGIENDPPSNKYILNVCAKTKTPRESTCAWFSWLVLHSDFADYIPFSSSHSC
jgi:hypothetical protein